MSYEGFYFRVQKRVEDMTDEELGIEIEDAEQVFASAEISGGGISSKETVRNRFATLERDRRKAGIALDVPIEEFARAITKMFG